MSTREREKEVCKKEGEKSSQVFLFTTESCPNCPRAKKALSDVGLDYTLVDAESQSALSQKYGIKSVPTLVVGDNVITGVGPIYHGLD